MNIFDVSMQVIGFQIQTIPYALLLLISLPKDCFQIALYKIACYIIVMLLIISIGFGIMTMCLSNIYAYDIVRTCADMYFLICIVIVCVLYFTLIHTMFIRKLMVFFIISHYGAFIFTLTAASTELIQWLPDSAIMVYYIKNNVINLFLIAVTYPFVALFMRRFVRTSLSQMEKKAMQRGCIYMISALILYCTSLFFLTKATYGIIHDVQTLYYILAMALTDIILYGMYYIEARLSIDNQALQLQLQITAAQYYKITNDIDEAKRIRHDLLFHIQKVATLYTEQKDQELKDYLHEYAQTLYRHDLQVITGHPLIDTVLKFYRDKAAHHHCVIKFSVDNFTSLHTSHAHDLIVVLSEVLDKTIDSIKEDEYDQSVIDLELYIHGSTCLCRIRYPYQIQKIINDPFEIDYLMHLCKQYMGNITIQQENMYQLIHFSMIFHEW